MHPLRPPIAGVLAVGAVLLLPACSSPAPSHRARPAEVFELRTNLPTPQETVANDTSNAPLTCINLVDRAWAASGERMALEYEATAAYHDGKVSNQPRNPEVRLGYTRGNSSADRFYYTDPFWPFEQAYPRHTKASWESNDASVRVFPRNPFVMYHTARQADATERVAKLGIEVERAAFSQTMAAMFVDQLFATRNLDLADQALEATSRAAEAASRALAAGAIQQEQHARAQRRRLDAMQEQASARDRVRQLSLAIAGALRIEPEGVELAEDLDWLAAVESLPLQTCLDVATSHRPDLQRIREETQAARTQLSIEHARLLPWISFLEGSYRMDEGTDLVTGRKDVSSPPWEELPPQQVYPGMATPLPRPTLPANISSDDDDSTSWRIRLGIELPVFNLFSHADNAAKSRYLAVLARERNLVSDIGTDVRRAHARLQDAKEYYNAFQTQCQRAAAPLSAALAAAEEHGGISDLQMAQLHADTLGLELRHQEARRRLFVARLALVASLGLTPRDCEREVLRALTNERPQEPAPAAP